MTTKRKADDEDSANGSDDGKGRKSGECDGGVARRASYRVMAGRVW